VGVLGHWNGFLVPVVAAAIASLVVVLATKFLSPPESPGLKIVGIFSLCLIASLVCWFAIRDIVRAAWPPAS
jgi:hypothetical protein